MKIQVPSFVSSTTDVQFIRRLLIQNNHVIPADLRCRTYSLLLHIDHSAVAHLAESTWPVDCINTNIIEDYIQHIFPRFSSSCIASSCYSLVDDEKRVCEDTLWVLQGVIASTSVPYQPCTLIQFI